MFSFESPHRGDSNEYTHYTVFNIKKKKITLNYPESATLRVCQGTSKRVRNSRGKLAIRVPATEGLLYSTDLNTAKSSRLVVVCLKTISLIGSSSLTHFCINDYGPSSFRIINQELFQLNLISHSETYSSTHCETVPADSNRNYYTVELQWLEHLWNHENMVETGVVRANECYS